MVTDPVCGMQLNEQKAEFVLVYENETYYFCSEGCRYEFQRHSEDYVKGAQTKPEGETDV